MGESSFFSHQYYVTIPYLVWNGDCLWGLFSRLSSVDAVLASGHTLAPTLDILVIISKVGIKGIEFWIVVYFSTDEMVITIPSQIWFEIWKHAHENTLTFDVPQVLSTQIHALAWHAWHDTTRFEEWWWWVLLSFIKEMSVGYRFRSTIISRLLYYCSNLLAKGGISHVF